MIKQKKESPMGIKDKDRKARANYQKKVVKVQFDVYPTEEDIKIRLEEMANGEGKATYIKRLIREDIAKKQ